MYDLQARSRALARRSAISYGPYGLAQSLLVGLILGCLVFVVGDALVSSNPGLDGDLPALLLCAGGGALFIVAIATAENYRIGKAVWEQVELERATFSNTHIPPPPFDENGDRLPAGAHTAWQARPRAAPYDTRPETEAAPANSDQRDKSVTIDIHGAAPPGGPGQHG